MSEQQLNAEEHGISFGVGEFLERDLISDRANAALLLDLASQALMFFFGLWGIPSEPPEIQILDNSRFIAEALPGRLLLSRGVIEEALRLERDVFSDREILRVFGVEFQGPNPLSSIFVIFIVAHELAHFGRSHHSILADHPYARHALEYDADCMAASALGQMSFAMILKQGIPFEEAELKAKRLSFAGIYWFFRNQIAPGEDDPATAEHPSWTTRVWYCLGKIASLGLKVNDNLHEPETRRKFSASIHELQDVFHAGEALLAKRLNTRMVPFFGKWTPITTVRFMSNIPKGNPVFDKLLRDWDRITPVVFERQLITQGW